MKERTTSPVGLSKNGGPGSHFQGQEEGGSLQRPDRTKLDRHPGFTRLNESFMSEKAGVREHRIGKRGLEWAVSLAQPGRGLVLPRKGGVLRGETNRQATRNTEGPGFYSAKRREYEGPYRCKGKKKSRL